MIYNSITVSREMFKGDVLDLSFGGFSILYSMYRKEKEVDVEYVERNWGKKIIEEKSFDTSILLFTLQGINSKVGKRNLLKEVSNYIRDTGYIHIWDIDKGYGKIYNGNVKVNLDLDNNEKKEEIIKLRNLNIITDNSMASMLKLIQEYFTVVTFKKEEEIYYIKCRKKGR